MKPNVESFIGCDSRSILPPASAPGRVLALRRCGTKVLGWKRTARIRTPI